MTRNGRVLLCVEDNLGDLRLLREALDILQLPHDLHHAGDGEQALAYLRRAQAGQEPWPDAVLLDLNLPRKSGVEVLAELGADARLRELRVIVLTTAARERASVVGAQTVPVSFMTKPLDFDDFIGVVKTIDGLIA
jgi:two-component system response regulator